MSRLFKRLQRAYRTESAFCFLARQFGSESLSHELLHAELEVEPDLRVHVTPADIAAAKHEIEETSNAGTDIRHEDQCAGAVRMSLTVSAYRSH